MKTIEIICDEVAKEDEYEEWPSPVRMSFLDDNGASLWLEVCKRYAFEVDKEKDGALKRIRFALYARETADGIYENVDQILTEAGYPWVADD